MPATTIIPSTTTSTPGPPGPPATPRATIAPATVVAPLTGLVMPGGTPIVRPALAVKIDNAERAHPQAGLNQADIVFEENVEGWTRFVAIFHSASPDLVGPVRSARTQDVDLLASLDRPLLAWSGGNAKVVAAIAASTLVDASVFAAPFSDAYSRLTDRPSPHNLFVRPEVLWSAGGSDPRTASAQFTYSTSLDPTRGLPADGVLLTMNGGMRARWTWNPELRRYERQTERGPQLDTAGQVLSADNVVVVVTSYRTSPADPRSPEAITVGAGDVVVMRAGTVVAGLWQRPDPRSPWSFNSLDGAPIALVPGRTWVELVTPDQLQVVPNGVDPASLGWPAS